MLHFFSYTRWLDRILFIYLFFDVLLGTWYVYQADLELTDILVSTYSSRMLEIRAYATTPAYIASDFVKCPKSFFYTMFI